MYMQMNTIITAFEAKTDQLLLSTQLCVYVCGSYTKATNIWNSKLFQYTIRLEDIQY